MSSYVLDPGNLPKLQAGDRLEILWRPEPYKVKLHIPYSGISIVGKPGPNGERPILDGDGAVEAPTPGYWANVDGNGLILVVPPLGVAFDAPQIAGIRISGLEIRAANQRNAFIQSGKQVPYNWGCGGVTMYRARNVTIANCTIHDNDNGVFGKSYGVPNQDLYDVRLSGNSIFGNGVPNYGGEHNSYIEGFRTVYTTNYYGPLRDTSQGMGIKDRSVRPVIAFNYVEGGGRLLELIEPADGRATMTADPDYGTVQAYNNVLVNHGQARTAVHFGFDQVAEISQKTLMFFSNTIITENTYPGGFYYTGIVKLNGGTTCFMSDNLAGLWSPEGGDPKFFYTAYSEYGTARILYGSNIVPPGTILDNDGVDLDCSGMNNVMATDPLFVDLRSGRYDVRGGSPAFNACKGIAGQIMPEIECQYDYRTKSWRARKAVTTLGAWEGPHKSGQ